VWSRVVAQGHAPSGAGDVARAGTSRGTLVETLARLSAARALAAVLEQGRRCVAIGSAGSSTVYLAGSIAASLGRTVVLVVAHADDADEAVDELSEAGVHAIRLAPMQSLPGESGMAIDLLADRLSVVRTIVGGDSIAAAEAKVSETGGRVVVCPIQALMQAVPSPERLPGLIRRVSKGDRVGPHALANWLEGAGYSRVDAIEEPGDYAVRGGIVDVFVPGAWARRGGGAGEGGGGGGTGAAGGGGVRFDFFGDEHGAHHRGRPGHDGL
jgi:transcription-repair coupling factor (superfamily II helicase)